VPYSVATPISWSSDGKWIAFSDPLPNEPKDRMYLLNVETLETSPIPHNPKCNHEAEPMFSHQGDQLAYICVHSTTDFELDSVAPFGGTPKFITSFSNFPIGFSWSSDDKRLIFSEVAESGPGPVLFDVTVADGSSQPS
jgi:Tol biopolymer transport system component